MTAYETISAKTILSKLKNAPDSWFGITYNMNLYRGCQHQCIYCDSRSECYRIDNFAKIQVKENALDILERELKSKKDRGTVGTGSMNDPYMPIEDELFQTRKGLELLARYRFPVHIITKNTLVLRDMDIIKLIAKQYAAVSITITTSDDALSKVIEPGAPVSSLRFEAIRQLSEAGIYCGVLLMPVLPFINDTEENLHAIYERAKSAGAKYLIPWTGMTLRDRQRDYYYQKLDAHFPGYKEKYQQHFGEQYSCNSPDSKILYSRIQNMQSRLYLPSVMEFYKPEQPQQLSLF